MYPSFWRSSSALLLAGFTAVLMLLLTSCGGSHAASGPLYVSPQNPAAAAAQKAADQGHSAEADALWRIAHTPSAFWVAGQPGEFGQVRKITQAAAAVHQIPVIVAYLLPDRDACGKLSGTHLISQGRYERLITQLAAAIGPRKAIVVVEPDGLADLARGCLTQAQAHERYTLLGYAMKHLSAQPHTQVYLDAGNPLEGLTPTPQRAQAFVSDLVDAGAAFGRGFSDNAANFDYTSKSVQWAQYLERLLYKQLDHHLMAVIDTSRNGNGPAPNFTWCNPPGRALGHRPELNPGPAGIAAYLWIKDPGASDGQCNGGPKAGQFWPKYGYSLVQNIHHN